MQPILLRQTVVAANSGSVSARLEINKENNPSVNISYLTTESNGNQAIAVFTQTMVADAQEASVRKIVGLENRKGLWLIVREDSMAVN